MSDSGKHPGGRPRRDGDAEAARAKRAAGESWAKIEKALGVSRQTILRAWADSDAISGKDPCPKLDTGQPR